MPRIRTKRRRTPFKLKRFRRKKIPLSAIRKANRKRKRSSLELQVAEWLKEDGIEFKQEKSIGRCHVDFFLKPNICLEINGCFYHGCATCNPKENARSKLARIKDIRRYAFFKSKDYDVVVIWEHEILEFPDRVREQLRGLGRVC